MPQPNPEPSASSLLTCTGLVRRFGLRWSSLVVDVQLGKSQYPKNDSNWLDSATEKAVQFVSVPLGHTDVEATIGPHDSA